MEKMKKIKNMCELEKYVGEMAHKKLMFCKGFYLSTGVPFMTIILDISHVLNAKNASGICTENNILICFMLLQLFSAF